MAGPRDLFAGKRLLDTLASTQAVERKKGKRIVVVVPAIPGAIKAVADWVESIKGDVQRRSLAPASQLLGE